MGGRASASAKGLPAAPSGGGRGNSGRGVTLTDKNLDSILDTNFDASVTPKVGDVFYKYTYDKRRDSNKRENILVADRAEIIEEVKQGWRTYYRVAYKDGSTALEQQPITNFKRSNDFAKSGTSKSSFFDKSGYDSYTYWGKLRK